MRFARMTSRLGIVCSIQLSYEDIVIIINEDSLKREKKNFYFFAAATASLRPFPALNFGTNLSFVLYFLLVPGTVPSLPF